ncbi:MAG TPA: RidA family protein [Alphaproteobacteria bacterium]|nr:RidA family protein [Alphaproteobacteria bacterium]
MHDTLLPKGWRRPAGYANGVAARGRTIYVAGQIGWNAQGLFETDDFTAQVRQALANVRAVLEAGGAAPRHLTRMTWYVTDKHEYLANLPAIGDAYRDVIGRIFPAMTLIEVKGLLEARAKVEIEATAVVPEPRRNPVRKSSRSR